LPLLSIDPDEIPIDGAAPDHPGLRQEALYCHFILSGMLRDYDVIHCVAPLVTPVQMLVFSGRAVCQTFLVPPTNPVPRLLTPLLSGSRLWVGLTPVQADGGSSDGYIPPSVDLARYKPSNRAKRSYVLYTAKGNDGDLAAAHKIADLLGKSLQTGLDADDASVLRDAYVLLDLAPNPSAAGPLWAIRTLASGVPVAAWDTAGLGRLLENKSIGAHAPQGDCELLARRISALPQSAKAAGTRRETILRSFSRRPVVARYLEIYRTLLGFR
jgi:hypothetical protein